MRALSRSVVLPMVVASRDLRRERALGRREPLQFLMRPPKLR